MTSERRAALIAGVLLIAGIVGALAFAAIEHPVLTATVSLAKIPANAGRLPAGGLIELATAGVSAGIAIALYPVLRTRSQALAVGAVAFRTIEATMYAVAGVITLSLPGIGRRYAQAAADGHGQIQATANSLADVRQAAILAGVLAYICGAVMYYYVLYRWRLLPRWLTGWGLAAEAVILIACVAAAYNHNPVTSYTALYLPIAAQETVFGAWLILRGFSPQATQPRTATSPALATNPEIA